MIRIDNLTKVYKGKNEKVTANDNISLAVKQGEIVGLLGHNGAGKTTLVNQVLGILKSTSGEITILGNSITKNPEQGRFLCSIQSQSQLSLGELTPMKAVTIMGLIRGGNKKDVHEEAMRLFEALDIVAWINKESSQLSGGVKRLTTFCMAVINSPQVIILDEPTNDVDSVRRRYLWSEIKKLTTLGKSVILVTHNVAEAENVVDKVIILHKGKIIASGTSGEIKGENGDNLRINFSPSDTFIKDSLPNWTLDIFQIDDRTAFTVEKERISETIDWLRGEIDKGNIFDYSLTESTLEDVYVKLTTEKQEVL